MTACPSPGSFTCLCGLSLVDAPSFLDGARALFDASQHSGLSLVTREVYAGLVAGGYRRLRVTFIAEDNPASAAVFAISSASAGEASTKWNTVPLANSIGSRG